MVKENQNDWNDLITVFGIFNIKNIVIDKNDLEVNVVRGVIRINL